MNDNYQKMKRSIISNIRSIRNLFEVADSLQASSAQIEDPALKKKMEEQVKQIFESITALTYQTEELFEAYKGLFIRS